MDPTSNKDPVELLMNFGSNPETWLLIGAPFLLLSIVAVAYVLVIIPRRRAEKRELATAADQLGKEEFHPVPNAPDLANSADDETDSYPIPKDLARVELTDDERPAPYRTDISVENLESLSRPRPQLRVVTTPDAEQSPSTPVDVAEVRQTDRAAWLGRLRNGLARTRASLSALIAGKARIDDQLLERLHEGLYRADVGVGPADKLVEHVRQSLGRGTIADWDQLSVALKERASSLLAEAQERPLNRPPQGPWVILVVGVNGVGKTTTIGKLAAHFLADGRKILLAAGDTFRAAAIQQLGVWGERLGVDVIRHQQGGDPAAVAYDAVKAAKARHVDVLLIDTAGRLHAKTELMEELAKVNRVIGKDLPGAPHETWLVIDGTTGQNAIQQVKAFREFVNITGLIVTKLDGTAKGGVLMGVIDQFKLPIRYIGVGEKAADLRAFVADDYVNSLF